MTKAADAFDRSILDAEDLLARFDAEKTSSNGKSGEVLKRAGLVMALAAWETYVKDRVTDEFDIWLQSVEGSLSGNLCVSRLSKILSGF